MKSFTFTITDPEGFHARPAGAFVKEAKKFNCVTKIAKDGKSVDARKMFGLMSLGIKGGETVTVEMDGEQENEAFEALQVFMKENL